MLFGFWNVWFLSSNFELISIIINDLNVRRNIFSIFHKVSLLWQASLYWMDSFKYSVRDLIFRLGLQKILEGKIEHRTNCILLEKALPRNHLSYQTVLGTNSSLAWNFLAFLISFSEGTLCYLFWVKFLL